MDAVAPDVSERSFDETLLRPSHASHSALRRRYLVVLSWLYNCLWLVAFAFFVAYELKAFGLALLWLLGLWVDQVSTHFPSLLTDLADAALMVLIGLLLKGQCKAAADRCEDMADGRMSIRPPHGPPSTDYVTTMLK